MLLSEICGYLDYLRADVSVWNRSRIRNEHSNITTVFPAFSCYGASARDHIARFFIHQQICRIECLRADTRYSHIPVAANVFIR